LKSSDSSSVGSSFSLPAWLRFPRIRGRNAHTHVRKALRGWVRGWLKIKYQISAILGEEVDSSCLLTTLLPCDCSRALNKTDLKPCCREFYVPDAKQWCRCSRGGTRTVAGAVRSAGVGSSRSGMQSPFIHFFSCCCTKVYPRAGGSWFISGVGSAELLDLSWELAGGGGSVNPARSCLHSLSSSSFHCQSWVV